jgi:hypothetical protein
MARSFYEARNRFVVNSKMDEKDFKVWLTLYLQGISVPEAVTKFPKLAGPNAEMPSTKTIANLFRRIGRYIFHKGFEPYLWSFDRRVPAEHLREGADAYQRHLDDVARNVIKYAKEAISLEQYHVLVQSEHVGKITDRIALEVRALLVARKGVSDPRADVGLAFLRALTPGSLPRNRMSADHILDMAENTLQHMLNDPMDEDGNTNSYLSSEPGEIHLNNNGVFEKKYWATRGTSIQDWKKKQWHKKGKRRLGYVRTSAPEQNLQEQRDALLAVNCCKIFEDINVSADDENWPGLDALLAEAFEYDTIVVLRLDRFGGLDARWAKVMTIIYEGGMELCAINDDFDTSKRILK